MGKGIYLAAAMACLGFVACNMKNEMSKASLLNSLKLETQQELVNIQNPQKRGNARTSSQNQSLWQQSTTASLNNPPVGLFFNRHEIPPLLIHLHHITKRPSVGKAYLSDQPGTCDEIFLFGGEHIDAKVTEVGEKEITYKLCNYLDGPLYTVKRSDVREIKYANGTDDMLTPVKSSSQGSFGKNVDGFGLASFLLGLFGIILLLLPSLAFLALIFSLLAIIFGAIGIGRVNNNSDTLNGRGFGITGLILGILMTLIWIILIAAVVAILL